MQWIVLRFNRGLECSNPDHRCDASGQITVSEKQKRY